MYYFYMGREAALLSAPGDVVSLAETATTATGPTRDSRSVPLAFASRLTYELRQLPEEPLPVVRTAPVAVSAVPASAAENEAARVANARPISAVVPQARDRTPAIEREAQKAEYHEVPRPQPSPAQAQVLPQPQPRVVEGREVLLKAPRLPDTPTRPIVADASVNMRAEIEAERSRLSAEVARAWPMPGNADASAARKGSEARPVIAIAPPAAGVPSMSRAAEPPRKEAEVKAIAPASPAAAAGGLAAAPGGSAAGEVENRLGATREWLAAAAPSTHTIQLMGTNSEEQLKGQLKALSKQLDPSKIFVFRTLAQGKPSITIVYGAYPDKTTAVQALEKLPAAITANRPMLRTVNGIRVEMKQHKTDS